MKTTEYINKRKHKSWLPFLAILSMLLMIGTTSCGLIKNLKRDAKEIGKEVGDGLVTSLDTNKLDSIIDRLVRVAGTALNDQIDSVELQGLRNTLSNTLDSVITSSWAEVRQLLQDTSAFDNMEQKLNNLSTKLTSNLIREIELGLAKTIGGTLTPELKRMVATITRELQDNLLSEETSTFFGELIDKSLDKVANHPVFDTLFNKVDVILDRGEQTVEVATLDISKTVKTIGLVIGGVLLALAILFLVLWNRQRKTSKRQLDLVVALTKAIDAIPEKEQYDHTIDHLQQVLSYQNDPKVNETLNKVLEEYKEQYPNKKKYKKYQDRLIEKIKEQDTDGQIRTRIINDMDDENLKDFAERSLN